MTQDTVISSALSRILYATGPTISNIESIAFIYNSIARSVCHESKSSSLSKNAAKTAQKLILALSSGVRSIHLTVVEVIDPFEPKTVGWRFEYTTAYPTNTRLAVTTIPFFIDTKGRLSGNQSPHPNKTIVWTRHAVERVYNRFMPLSDHESPGLLVQVLKNMSVDAIQFVNEFSQLNESHGIKIIPVSRGHFTYEEVSGSFYMTTYIDQGLYLDDQQFIDEVIDLLNHRRTDITDNYYKYLRSGTKIKIHGRKLRIKSIAVYKPKQNGLYYSGKEIRS